MTLFLWQAVYILMLLGWLFVPVYMSSNVFTMPEYLKKRFGGQRIRVYLSFLALLLYIFTKISADLYAGALFIQLALNKNSPEWLYLSILFLLVIAAVFTIAGGLTAVVWTDFVQTILMIVGSFILMVISFREVGGYQNLIQSYPSATASERAVGSGNVTCGEPPADYMNLIRTIEPGKSNYPWTGMIFGLTINSIWYWCTDQVIVQRTLASKNMSHAKGGCILAAYLKFLPMWLLVFPGMAARVLFPDRVACASPEKCRAICGSPGGCSNIAYVELVLNLLPSGLSGLMLAVMMAALMSSLTSIFNSASTIFTMDVWQLLRKLLCKGTSQKQASDRELLFVGRIFVGVLVVISVVWIPVIQNTGNSQLFDYIQSISSFLAPPICAVYILAIFWGRTTEPGAFYGLMVGLAIGLLRFILEFSYTAPPCGSGEDQRGWFLQAIVGKVHYLHFSCILWIITLVVTISVSLITEPIPEQCLYRLTYWTRKDSRARVCVEDRATLPPPSITNGSGMAAMKVQDEQPSNLTEDGEQAVAFLYEHPFWKALVVATLKLHVKSRRISRGNHTVFHLEKLKDLTCAHEYAVAVSNRFDVLGALEDPVELWDTFKRETLQAAKECIGERPRSRRCFVSTEMLENI
ncbi:Sodium/glucose cotransporter 4 [Chionoecetes opilio]|uniref:Sodium/glucose cotransporter 4 n=1 Tax=Chionoecetes opilio TaxID=41210 RepID=A0A8J4XQY1_CHIOP|nr:Sodium/glucose cotransporter 4 [Chionoecetes opilio]